MNDTAILSSGLKLIADRMGMRGLARFIQLVRGIRIDFLDKHRMNHTVIWLPSAKPYDATLLGMGVEMTGEGIVKPIPNGQGMIIDGKPRENQHDLVAVMLDGSGTY